MADTESPTPPETTVTAAAAQAVDSLRGWSEWQRALNVTLPAMLATADRVNNATIKAG